VQAGLVAELDMAAMYELVGEKVREIFDASSIYIGIPDEQAGTIEYPYDMYLGERIHTEPMVLGEGLSSRVLSSRESLRVGALDEGVRLGYHDAHPGRAPKRVVPGRPDIDRRTPARHDRPRVARPGRLQRS
jgi:hypothetical protein